MKKFIPLLSSFLVLFSCQKEGQTGEHAVIVTPVFENAPVRGATVMVRFGASDFPGSSPSDYDLTVQADSISSEIKVEKLRKGDYYFYCFGSDSLQTKTVSGGSHLKIREKTGETVLPITLKE